MFDMICFSDSSSRRVKPRGRAEPYKKVKVIFGPGRKGAKAHWRGGRTLNLDPAVQKPRMTRMTRMGTGFVMVENLFRGPPPGEYPLHRDPFFIRVIREIRGSNCCFLGQNLAELRKLAAILIMDHIGPPGEE